MKELEVVEIVHLPPSWASYLNELAFFRNPNRDAFEEGLRDARAWWYFESAYWIDAGQKQQFENLDFLLAELEGGGPLEKVLPQAFEVVKIMESVQAARDKASYSVDPLINDMVLAGACLLKGQGEQRAVSERLPRLQVWGEKLREGFLALRESLPEEAVRDLEVGFAHLEQAMDEFTSMETLPSGMARLVETSDLLRVLVQWRQQARARQMERFRRWAIPMVGAGLEECFLAMRGLNPVARAELWAGPVTSLWLELSSWWGQQRELLPLPADFLTDWIAQVDLDLDELTEFEPGEQISDATLAELEGWVDAVAQGFAEAGPKMQASGHLRGGAAGHYYEVIQGLLRNTLPVPAVPALFEAANPPEAWKSVVEAMLEYTKGGPRELLYEARDELLRLVPPPDVSEGGEWTCPFCQQPVPAGRSTCGHCGGGASVSLEVRSWNA